MRRSSMDIGAEKYASRSFCIRPCVFSFWPWIHKMARLHAREFFARQEDGIRISVAR